MDFSEVFCIMAEIGMRAKLFKVYGAVRSLKFNKIVEFLLAYFEIALKIIPTHAVLSIK